MVHDSWLKVNGYERRGDSTVPVVLILACRTRGFIGKADI